MSQSIDRARAAEPPSGVTAGAPESLGSRAARALRREVREHKTAYAVLVAFTFGGMAIVPMIFPDATPVQGALGGGFLGVWAALSAVPGHFF